MIERVDAAASEPKPAEQECHDDVGRGDAGHRKESAELGVAFNFGTNLLSPWCRNHRRPI